MELIVVILLLVSCFILEKRYRVVLYSSQKQRFFVVGIIFTTLMVWEIINRFIFQAWLYPGTGMVGINFIGLPLELYLFYFVAPYFSFVIYELIHREVDKN